MKMYSDPDYGYKEGIAMTQTQAFPPFKKLSFYRETHTVALPYTIASTGQNTERMETAKDILERHRQTGAVNVPLEDALAAMKEIAEKCFDAGRSHEHAAHFGSVPNVHPDKSTYMKQLFPE